MAGVFWESPDIAVRNADDGRWSTSLHWSGQTNYVYVRAQNGGLVAASGVHVNLRAVRFPGTEFTYPLDWTVLDATHSNRRR